HTAWTPVMAIIASQLSGKEAGTAGPGRLEPRIEPTRWLFRAAAVHNRGYERRSGRRQYRTSATDHLHCFMSTRPAAYAALARPLRRSCLGGQRRLEHLASAGRGDVAA